MWIVYKSMGIMCIMLSTNVEKCVFCRKLFYFY